MNPKDRDNPARTPGSMAGEKLKSFLGVVYIALLSICILAVKRIGKLAYYSLVAAIEGSYRFLRDTKEITFMVCRELFKGALQAVAFFKAVLKRAARLNREKDGFLIAAAAAALCVTVSVGFISTYSFGMKVLCSDQVIGSVEDAAQFEKILLEFEQKTSEQLGESYRSPLSFEYRFALVKNDDAGDVDLIEREILKLSPDIDRLYVLKVDGKILAANKDRSEIEGVLDEILALNTTGEEEKIEFTRDVYIEYQLCKESAVMDAEELRVMLLSPAAADNEITHSVQKGETISIIAKKYGVSEGQLISENEEVDIDNLSQGKELVVSNVKSLLPVMAVKEIAYTREIPYATERIDDKDIYINRTKTLQQGVKGVELITAEVTMIDGEEIGRSVLKTEVLSAPVTERIAVGVKALPPGVTTGTFIWPSDGYVSSYYGSRWGRTHTGLDIAKAYGVSIYAADGGKVTFTGWKGNYGLTVILDHGDGVETMYAHCSELLVNVGEEIPKGFEIAKMGSTGNSTGNHVHFEVIIDGVQKNPLNYLSQ